MKTNIPNDVRETVNDIFSKYEKILRNGIAPRDVGGKRKTIKSKKKSKKRFRKTRSKGGKATLPTNNNRRRSDLHDPANLGFIQHPPEYYNDDDDFDDDFVDDDFVDDDEYNEFVRVLYSTIATCLESAEHFVAENHNSINHPDWVMPEGSYVCRDLVRLLQSYTDTIGRLRDDDKQNIYSVVFKHIDDHRDHHNDLSVEHTLGAVNILKFYFIVHLDILMKIRRAFRYYQPLPPLPQLIPIPPRDVGGKRIKKQRRTRKSVKRKIKKSKRKKSVKRRKRITKKHKIII
jgi:hypothetical protein